MFFFKFVLTIENVILRNAVLINSTFKCIVKSIISRLFKCLKSRVTDLDTTVKIVPDPSVQKKHQLTKKIHYIVFILILSDKNVKKGKIFEILLY